MNEQTQIDAPMPVIAQHLLDEVGRLAAQNALLSAQVRHLREVAAGNGVAAGSAGQSELFEQ